MVPPATTHPFCTPPPHPQLVYATLEPGTTFFLEWVERHIPGPYLLITDTADTSIVRGSDVDAMLSSPKLFHWWAVNNEVVDSPKLEGLPLGIDDALEGPGMPGKPTGLLACRLAGWLNG